MTVFVSYTTHGSLLLLLLLLLALEEGEGGGWGEGGAEGLVGGCHIANDEGLLSVLDKRERERE